MVRFFDLYRVCAGRHAERKFTLHVCCHRGIVSADHFDAIDREGDACYGDGTVFIEDVPSNRESGSIFEVSSGNYRLLVTNRHSSRNRFKCMPRIRRGYNIGRLTANVRDSRDLIVSSPICQATQA